MLCTHFLMTEYTSDSPTPDNSVRHTHDSAPVVVSLPEADAHTSVLQRYTARLRRLNFAALLYSV